MGDFHVFQTMTLADMVGVFIILSIALGVFALMWMDYKRYLEESESIHFRILEFVKKEQLFIFLFLMFLFLIGGEVILYSHF